MDRLAKLAPRLVLIPALAWLGFIAVILRADLMDDAYISLRYLHNLLAGNGLVFNPGERVEGITNLGWIIFLAPFAAIMGEVAAAKIMGLLLAAATVILAGLVAEKLAPPNNRLLFILPVPLLVAFQSDFVLFANLGMETALLSTLILAALYLIITNRFPVFIALLFAFAFLVHPEAGLIFPLFLLLSFRWDERNQLRQRHRAPLLVFVGAVAAFTLARCLYFGDPLPHTFYAKTTGPADLVRAVFAVVTGTNHNIGFPLNNLPGVAVMALGALVAAERSRAGAAGLAAAAAAGLLFAVYAPGDWTGRGRYFAPYAPAALVLAWTGLAAAHQRLLAGRLAPPAVRLAIAAWAALLILTGIGQTLLPARNSYRARYPGYVLLGRALVKPSLWMRDNLPADAVIATRRIGAAGYYSDKIIFDYKFGLVDRDAAKIRRDFGPELGYPSNPVLQDLWQQRAPDYLLEDSPIIDHLIQESAGSPDRFELHGLAYRELQRFPIGAQVDWVVCERIK